MENEGHVAARQATRQRRHEIRPKTEIKNRHREVPGVRPRHRLIKRMAHVDDDRAHPAERGLEIHRQQQIVFDDKHRDTAQRTVVVH